MSKKNEYKIGIPGDQTEALFNLQSRYLDEMGNDIDKPEVWLGHKIAVYIIILIAEAEKENIGKITQKNHTQRRESIKPLEHYFDRFPEVEDLVGHLEKKVKVPSHLEKIIEKDLKFLKNL